MKIPWRKLTIAVGLAAGLAMAAPGCVVRASVAGEASTAQEPPDPTPRYRTPAPRSGHIWVRGHYTFRSGKWTWRQGRWKRARSGYSWTDGRWERRGNRWHWVAGRWVSGPARARVRHHPSNRDDRHHTPPPRNDRPNVVDKRDRRGPPPREDRPNVVDKRDRGPRIPPGAPTQKPPAPRYKRQAARRGYIWVRGHWEWRAGKYNWIDGHWERKKSRMRWEAGRWEHRGGAYYEWIPGKWAPL